jgi:hypothetical protein
MEPIVTPYGTITPRFLEAVTPRYLAMLLWPTTEKRETRYLDYAFIWEEAPQGASYWREKYQRDVPFTDEDIEFLHLVYAAHIQWLRSLERENIITRWDNVSPRRPSFFTDNLDLNLDDDF